MSISGLIRISDKMFFAEKRKQVHGEFCGCVDCFREERFEMNGVEKK